MGNNPKREAGIFPPLFFLPVVLCLFCFLFFRPAGLKAQKLSKYYVSFKAPNGTLYFIRPQKGYKSEKGDRLKYDMTLLSSSDSLTLNFSYFDPLPLEPDSLTLTIGDRSCVSPLSKIFVETSKKNWHYRLSARFAVKDQEEFFKQEKASAMVLSSKDRKIVLNCKSSFWRKYAPINLRIFQLVRYNR